MGFAEFSKIISKATESNIKEVKEAVEGRRSRKKEVVAPSPKIDKVVTRKKPSVKQSDELEDIVEQQEPQIDIEIPEIEEQDVYQNVDKLSLFDYKKYDTNVFTGLDAMYSCLRFDQLKSELSDRSILKYHEFPGFNYRIYYSREYKSVANNLLSRLIKSENDKLISVMNIPVLINEEESLITICKDYYDNLDMEYAIKIMLLDRHNFTSFKIIVLENYEENIIKEVEDFIPETLTATISYLSDVINSTKTYEYTESDLCTKCIFKSTCEKHSGPLAFTIIKR